MRGEKVGRRIVSLLAGISCWAIINLYWPQTAMRVAQGNKLLFVVSNYCVINVCMGEMYVPPTPLPPQLCCCEYAYTLFV